MIWGMNAGRIDGHFDRVKLAHGLAHHLALGIRPQAHAIKCYVAWACESGRQDLNLRPLDPQSSALPGCATSRTVKQAVF